MTKKELEKKIWDQLATVIDPELGIDIVNMGLVYSVTLAKTHKHQWQLEVEMTLTTAGCPLAGVIHAMVMTALVKIDSQVLPKENIKLNLVFDPPWTPDMMSSEAKEKLKFFL